MIGALALGAALACGPARASASNGHSSPEDRQRFVSITHELEQAPLKPGGRADRAWALEWLTETRDVTVVICADPLVGAIDDKYPYAGEIVVQEMFSMGAFAIEHPDLAKDPNAQQLAGAEGALNAYRAILRDKPDATLPALENLLRLQSRGELPGLIRKAWISCSKKKK